MRPIVKHIAHLLDLCDAQRTITTTRLKRELIRVNAQATAKYNSMLNQKMQKINELNQRAQKAESELAKLKGGKANGKRSRKYPGPKHGAKRSTEHKRTL